MIAGLLSTWPKAESYNELRIICQSFRQSQAKTWACWKCKTKRQLQNSRLLGPGPGSERPIMFDSSNDLDRTRRSL